MKMTYLLERVNSFGYLTDGNAGAKTSTDSTTIRGPKFDSNSVPFRTLFFYHIRRLIESGDTRTRDLSLSRASMEA